MRITRRYFEADGTALRDRSLRQLDNIPGDCTRAYSAFNAAKARGDIVAPSACSKCGNTGARIFGHHDSYERPLDVTWLCGGCHSARHVEIRLANAKALGLVVVERRARESGDPNKGACIACNSRGHDKRRCPSATAEVSR